MSEVNKAEELRLSHWSYEPYIPRVHNRTFDHKGYRSCYDKPQGFWVSVDGEADWETWARSNGFGIGNFRHRVHLVHGANVLRIHNPSDLLAFREKYGREKVWGTNNQWTDIYIAWEDVAKDCQGIIIAPHLSTAAMYENWYYGWDCASGCIWDGSAISCVEPAEEIGMTTAPRSELPCAGTPLSPPAKQATPIVDPLGGDCGVVPVSALDTGPLEPDNCAIVHALTAHENY